jgi:UDP-N-acetyl-D-glucosamine dehydrogenase
MQGVELGQQWLNEADCVVIVTDHSALDWTWIVSNSKLIVDTRNVTAAMRSNGHRIVRL